MKHFITLFLAVMMSSILSAQGFPKAEKQPKFKEQRGNQKKYRRWSHRRHVKRGTVYVAPSDETPVCVLTDRKYLTAIA